MKIFAVKYLDKLGRVQKDYLTENDLINISEWSKKMVNSFVENDQQTMTDLKNRYTVKKILKTRKVKPGNYDKAAEHYSKVSLMLESFPFDEGLFRVGKHSFNEESENWEAKQKTEITLRELSLVEREIANQIEFLEAKDIISLRNF